MMMTNAFFLLSALLLLATHAVPTATAVLTDEHESCEFWASIGECDKNPQYMNENCLLSCSRVGDEGEDDVEDEDADADAMMPESFYDIEETDLYGKRFRFEAFRGKVVYMVNVASKCGYTASNYEQFRNLKKYNDRGLIMVLAPCNAFGFQEPGGTKEIEAFAKAEGFKGLILSKDEVNGERTRPAFRFLKAAAQKDYISWNFDGKFLIDRDGDVHAVGDDVEDRIQQMLDEAAPASHEEL
jgi:glutathione peroxidase-family protein